MSLRVLKYMSSRGPVSEAQIAKDRPKWDKSYGNPQNVRDLMDELFEHGLVTRQIGPIEVGCVYTISEKGKKVSNILEREE